MTKGISSDLQKNVVALDNRIWHNKKASMILIDGGLGEGKTTLAVGLVDEVNKLHNLPPLDLNDPVQLAMGGVEFIRKLNECYARGFPVIIYDESGDFNKRGYLTRLNQTLNRVFETFRAYKILVILVLPSISDLDKSLFDKNIPRLYLRCYARNHTIGRVIGFDLDRINWLRYWFKQLAVKNDAYRKVTPLFHAYFFNLSPERSLLLDKVSTASKQKELGAASIKLEGLLNYEDLMGKLGRSMAWVKAGLVKLKIKPKRLYQRKAYFDSAAVERLLDLLK